LNVLLHPAYFPNIATFAVMAQRQVVWEVHDNFQKQTYRNRCLISTDKGKHPLLIPIRHRGGTEGRQKYAEVAMDNSYNWKKLHWRTLETAYRTSPFFEFYEDDLRPLYRDGETSLLDFNLRSIEITAQCLGLDMPQERTEGYQLRPTATLDARFLVEAKRERPTPLDPYPQVFGERHGPIHNLSVLDLLFNLGTQALDYLKGQHLDFLHA